MVFTSSASVVSRVGASSPARSALMLWRMARSSHPRASGPPDGRQRSPRFWPRRPSPRGRTTEQAAALFGNSRHRLNPFNENNVLSKSGQHRLTRKAYQIRPSPLRRNGRCRLQAQSVLQPLPDWRSPGAESQRRRSRSGATRSHAQPRRASMARIASTHPLTRRWGQRPQLNKPTSGRQARPPKGGSGALLGQSFYVHKNISGYSASRGQIAHVAWQRISAPFVKTVEPSLL